MRAREFERKLEALSLWRASEIDQRTRGLRNAGLLPVGGRGLNAPDIEVEHATAILIALAATDRAADAAQAVLSYSAMPLTDGKEFAGAKTFLVALTAVLGDPKYSLKVDEVVICRTWPEAVVKFGKGKRLEAAVYRRAGALPRGYGHATRIDATLSGGLLHELATDLAGLNDDAPDYAE